MKLYIKTTKDKYELPLAVAESVAELAKMVGHSKGTVASMITRNQNGYRKIVIDDDEA